MRASLTVDRSATSSSVMVLKVSVCLILMAMSHAKDSHKVLIWGSLAEFRRTRVIHQSQYLLTAFSVPNLMRIQAQRTASTPSWIMLRPLTSQSDGSLETN